MVATLVLASVMTLAAGTPPADRHVRSTDRQIQMLIEKGVARSATFRHLLDTLDASDVIVYVDPKQMREALAGYLTHHVTVAGSVRYIRVKVDTWAAPIHAIAVLAHELQHAIEVAREPDVRDDRSLMRLFERVNVQYVCAGDCFETLAAIEIQQIVIAELREWPPTATLASSR